MDAAGAERVGQRTHDVFLAHKLGEPPGAPLAGEDEVGHAVILPRGPAASAARGDT